MKVLITGGAGFIGSHYVHLHRFLRPHDDLVVLDALTYSGDRAHLQDLSDLHFVEGHIEDPHLVRELFSQERFEAVLHFAAETHVDRSIKNPSVFVSTNVLGTQILLDAARDFDVRRFHHVSTDEVYGDLGLGSTERFSEDSPLSPSSPYSATKAASDLLCLAYRRTYGLPVTVSRCSNNYGPHQSLENLIPRLITRAQAGASLPLYGKGENVRDWLFVQDHCHAILKILESGRLGEVYNIGGASERSNLEVARLILKLLQRSEDQIEFIEDRKGHDGRYAIDFSKLHHELDWSPSLSLEEGVRFTLEWYTLAAHERNFTRWWNRVSTFSTHQSHE
jgi:dTDP-glucose 4,6-dehydratase